VRGVSPVSNASAARRTSAPMVGGVSEPRKHHVVPQLYQKGFARRRGAVWRAVVVDRATGQARGPMTIRDIFAERDYNTIIDADGNRDYAAEQLLAEHVEAEAARGLERLRTGAFPLAEIDRGLVAIFMAAQLSRGRALRNNFVDAISEVMSMALTLTAQNASDEPFERVLGHRLSADQRQSLINNREHLTIRPSNAAILQAALSPVADIAGLLLKRTWSLVEFDEPCLFTGEHPVVRINPSGDSGGYGVVTAEQLYMPVSTTNALVLSHPWTAWPEARIYGNAQLAQRLNWAMLTQPSNFELLLHPDVEAHPLPSPTVLLRDPHWPWRPDSDSLPVFMHDARAHSRTIAAGNAPVCDGPPGPIEVVPGADSAAGED
jgi:hypothetical protein